jgi:hypothetical protein
MAEEHGRWTMAHTFDSLKNAMKVLLNHLRIECELLVLTFDGRGIGSLWNVSEHFSLCDTSSGEV